MKSTKISINNMIIIADSLDDIGMYQESDIIDGMMMKIAAQNVGEKASKKSSIQKIYQFFYTCVGIKWLGEIFGHVLSWAAKKWGVEALSSLSVGVESGTALPAEFMTAEFTGLVQTIAGYAAGTAGVSTVVAVGWVWFFMEVLCTIPEVVKIIRAWLRGEDVGQIEPTTIIAKLMAYTSEKIGNLVFSKVYNSGTNDMYYEKAVELAQKDDAKSLTRALDTFKICDGSKKEQWVDVVKQKLGKLGK